MNDEKHPAESLPTEPRNPYVEGSHEHAVWQFGYRAGFGATQGAASLTPRNPADRPATEPRTHIPIGATVIKCICDEWHDVAFFVRLAEAAQGAAPLHPQGIEQEFDRGYRLGLAEGAAPRGETRAEGHPRTYSLVGSGLDMFLVTDDESGFNIGYARKIGGPITRAAPHDCPLPSEGAAPRGETRAEGLGVERLGDAMDEHALHDHAPDHMEGCGPQCASAILSRLSLPSDEREEGR